MNTMGTSTDRKNSVHIRKPMLLKPGDERQIPYDLAINRNLINKTNKQNITKDNEIENRLTVTRGERGGDYRGKG